MTIILHLQEREEHREKLSLLRGEAMRKDSELNIASLELEETKHQLKQQLKYTVFMCSGHIYKAFVMIQLPVYEPKGLLRVPVPSQQKIT